LEQAVQVLALSHVYPKVAFVPQRKLVDIVTEYYQQLIEFFFVIYILCILIIIKVFSPTDTQLDSLKNNFKFALKLTLKSSYMLWCKTPSSRRTLV